MRETDDTLQQLKVRLAAILHNHLHAILDEWLTCETLRAHGAHGQSQEIIRSQAEAFLALLADIVERDGLPSAAWALPQVMQDTPRLITLPDTLALATILVRYLTVEGDVDAGQLLAVLQEVFTALPKGAAPERSINERLGRLALLSWTLNSQNDQDSIMQITMQEAPALVGASSCTIWLWDADQQYPVMMVTAKEVTASPQPPASLLQFFQQTCKSCGAFSIDAGESDDCWPTEMQHTAVAFIPLPGQHGCLGIITVHHLPGVGFSYDDILLLSSFGNLVATALRNVQLRANERQLINLLQSSIRQVVRASAGLSERDQHKGFVQSLLHVAEGLTRAEAVATLYQIDEYSEPVIVSSKNLPEGQSQQLAAIMRKFCVQFGRNDFPSGGLVHEVFPEAEAFFWNHYSAAVVSLGGKRNGVVVAFGRSPFSLDQDAFLNTMAEQIGVGIDNRVQSENLQRLLFELSNVNYISETITSTFDPHRIFELVSKAGSQALNAPIALCGWLEDDGSIRVYPDTTIGIPQEIAQRLGLTYNNTVIRAVLDQHRDVSSRTLGKRVQSAFPSLRALKIVDWVCVPMMVKPRARGFMLIADVRPRVFTPHDIAILSTYANQAALAMENSLLYDQLDRQLQQMEQLYQVTRSVRSTLDVTTVLQELQQAATKALHVPAAIICLSEEGTGIQRVVTSIGIESAALSSLQFELGEDLIGTVGVRGEPIISTNLLRDGRSTTLRDLARLEGFIASLTVPMLVQGTNLGTVTVISHEARDFSPAYVQLLQAMATEAAIAVQNARLYEQERARTQTLRVWGNEMSKRISSSVEMMDVILDITQRTEPSSSGLSHARQRLACIAAVQRVVSEDAPEVADLKDAVTQMVNERLLHLPPQVVRPNIRVAGAHLLLPSRDAMALALFIHEWLQSFIEDAEGVQDAWLQIALQQLGRNVLVQIESPTEAELRQARVNRDIIAEVAAIVHGTVIETTENDIRRVRLRFSRPTAE